MKLEIIASIDKYSIENERGSKISKILSAPQKTAWGYIRILEWIFVVHER